MSKNRCLPQWSLTHCCSVLKMDIGGQQLAQDDNIKINAYLKWCILLQLKYFHPLHCTHPQQPPHWHHYYQRNFYIIPAIGWQTLILLWGIHHHLGIIVDITIILTVTTSRSLMSMAMNDPKCRNDYKEEDEDRDRDGKQIGCKKG